VINLELNVSKRINKIYSNEVFTKNLADILLHENKRVFCKHNMEHFLDVARIMYIITLENNFSISKDIIYACAILHDIGRAKEYKEGIEHHIASASLAKEILPSCDFTNYEIDIICNAIQDHRNITQLDNILSSLLYVSDKLSRNCFSCNAISSCKWTNDKMNLEIKY